MQTLQTFYENTSLSLDIGSVYANVDLFGGSRREQKECASILSSFYPKAFIRLPKKASFGDAVKFLWSKPESEFFIHLEDDWVTLREFDVRTAPLGEDSRVRQFQFVKPTIDQGIWSKFRWRPLTMRPLYLPNYRRPSFTTSPSIIESGFAKEVSRLMQGELNPEKQFFNGLNRELESFSLRFRSQTLVRWFEDPIIQDIGRTWKEENGVVTSIIDGRDYYQAT
jgi:hypothetical protein